MCGLVGFLYNKDKVDSEISSQLLSMTKSISHRGPDDDGFWIDDVCWLDNNLFNKFYFLTGNNNEG